ncbi:hypothetical protein GBA52_002866 [Prunus armeniaca]|nr:hypothetical protein GBA52_002866 [Prunus armeniaca]
MYKSENQIWAVTKLRRCSTFKAGTHIGDDDPEAFREASAWDWRKKKKALREALTLMEIWKVSFFVSVCEMCEACGFWASSARRCV